MPKTPAAGSRFSFVTTVVKKKESGLKRDLKTVTDNLMVQYKALAKFEKEKQLDIMVDDRPARTWVLSFVHKNEHFRKSQTIVELADHFLVLDCIDRAPEFSAGTCASLLSGVLLLSTSN